ncbi:45225_t:CDS:2, partial [Gigaspora margarita]
VIVSTLKSLATTTTTIKNMSKLEENHNIINEYEFTRTTSSGGLDLKLNYFEHEMEECELGIE